MAERVRNPADVAMDRYAAGDAAAFAAVYDGVAPRVFAYLRRQTRDDARAEDLVQQTLLSIHRARGTFVCGSAVLPWAFAIARRHLIDDLRRGKRTVRAKSELTGEETYGTSLSDPPDGHMEAHQTASRLHQELVRLPDAQRAAFELLRLEGLSHLEAAEVLGASVTAVKLRAHRAYQALRHALGEANLETTLAAKPADLDR